MPADITITGVDKLEAVARRLRETGDKELRTELYRGLQRAAKPLKDVVKRSALQNLPRRGGLNEFVASARISTRTRGGGRNPGVTLKASKAGHDLRSMDKGRLRHPVFGRPVWVSQSVRAGWFTEPLEAEAPAVRKELVQVLDDVAKRIARG